MHTGSHLNHKKTRGFTLTEIAIVLGIIGIILGAIWVAAGAVYNNLRVSTANREVLQVAQGVRRTFATSSNVGAQTAAQFTTSLICANAVPGDMVVGNCAAGTLNNPFPAGVTTVQPTTEATGGLGFVITMTNIPQAACANLVLAVAGQSRDPGLFVAQTAYTVAAVGNPLPNAATLQTAQGTAANGIGGCTAATNTTSFGFSLR